MEEVQSDSAFLKGNFIGLHRTDETNALQRNHPKAFLLLCLIARRARYTRESCKVTGLKYRQAYIGDFREAGLKTIGEYRNAKTRLEELGLCAFKGVKVGANRGTTATLLPQRIFSIDKTGTTNGATIQQPSSDHPTTIQQPQRTKKQINKETKKHSLSIPKEDLEKVEEIYQAYPKKKGKPSALKSIANALQSIDHQTLLERTKAYAKAREGENAQYTPQPATWFNDERFNDEPSTWKSALSSQTPASQPRQTVAELTAGKSSNIINASDLNFNEISDHD